MDLRKQLKNAIEEDGRSCYALAKESKVDASVLSRFMRGERGLNLDTADRLLQVLGLDVRLTKKRK